MDHTNVFKALIPPYTGNILEPFAVDELLCGAAAQTGQTWLHFWRHPSALVLGLRDRKLPNAQEVMERLKAEGVSVAVRHSGGAAVPLDSGVINVSLIRPKETGALGYQDDFELMFQWIRQTLSRHGLHVERGEITGSYCPGDYDLSVGGRKFCGIAQRRQLKAYAVQAFVVVEGEGEARAKRARHFYDQAVPAGSAVEYPLVHQESTSSLQQFLGQTDYAITGEWFVEAMLETVQQQARAYEEAALPFREEEVMATIEKLHQRYNM